MIPLTEKQATLVGLLIPAVVRDFYPAGWFDWDEVAELREHLISHKISVPHSGTSFETGGESR